MKIPNPLNARYGFFLLLISLELCFPVTRIPNQTEINNQDKNNEILAWFAFSSWPKIQFVIDGNKPGKAGDLVTDSHNHNLEDSPLPTALGVRRVCAGDWNSVGGVALVLTVATASSH